MDARPRAPSRAKVAAASVPRERRGHSFHRIRRAVPYGIRRVALARETAAVPARRGHPVRNCPRKGIAAAGTEPRPGRDPSTPRPGLSVAAPPSAWHRRRALAPKAHGNRLGAVPNAPRTLAGHRASRKRAHSPRPAVSGHLRSAHSQTTQPAQSHLIRTGGLRRRLTLSLSAY